MSRSRPIALVAATCLCLGAVVGPAAAQDSDAPPEQQQRQPEAMVDALVDQLLSTLETLLEAIPQYEMPEMNERGDIIIRRKRPVPEPPGSTAKPEAVET